MTTTVIGYVATVLGIIAVAFAASLGLQGLAAKAHRHWDADINRIIATQQDKKRTADVAALARAEAPAADDERPRIAALTTGAIAAGGDNNEPVSRKAVQPKSQTGRRSSRRAEKPRRQHFIPAAFATLPKFATTAVATTTTLLRLR